MKTFSSVTQEILESDDDDILFMTFILILPNIIIYRNIENIIYFPTKSAVKAFKLQL